MNLCQNSLPLVPAERPPTDKSEVVLLRTPAQLQSATNISTVDVAGSTLPVASKLKLLGVTIDSNLRFDCHARNIAKTCNFHTRALRHVHSLLTDDVAQTVACSIVASRLDYCNALLSGAHRRRLSTSYSAPRTTWPQPGSHRRQAAASLATLASSEAAGHL